jgi:hypothetical protein
MNEDEDEIDLDATNDQLAELRRHGIAESELIGLTADDAEEWICQLREKGRDPRRFDSRG